MAQAKMDRRHFLKSLAAVSIAAGLAPGLVGRSRAAGREAAALREKIDHVVVIFQENRSFDHYFGTFQAATGQGILNLLDDDGRIARHFDGLQKNPAGIPYPDLPLPPEIPAFAHVQLPNRPFHLGPFMPADSRLHWDPKHRFYRMLAQMHDGGMDRFVALAGSGTMHLRRQDFWQMDAEEIVFDLARPSGPVLGYYDAGDLPFYHRVAHSYTLFDHCFQAMSGGSTGNALYLVAARSCVHPKVAPEHCAPFDPRESGKALVFFDLPYDHRRVLINDLPPIQGPTDAGRAASLKISPPPAAQDYANIGDLLSGAGLDWAWYNENWHLVKNWALKNAFGPGDGSAIIDSSSIYVAHHNPFQYYPRWPDYVRAGHMRDSQDFLEDARRGHLPAVSFLKASAAHDEHPADCAPAQGMAWVEQLVRAVADGPAWERTAIFITYDEGGGFWDSLPPPSVDAYGFGTRVPLILVSPWARRGFVDHHPSSTASILRFIEQRFGLPELNARDGAAYDLLDAFDWTQKPQPFSI
ncbi:alkaline phosphatase family protein [Acidithiobacillus sp.]|uniref:phospholipase C n=1 Tax=Acidithiobacillus sp. TaxID=1872118 RepID=UPI0025C71FA9|nr:alkaline phosphatase family protein [Acidithiobacillus sp.]